MGGVHKVRVTYADTDAMGVVYHTNYIKWFEVGRTELLRNEGIIYAALERDGYYLPVTECACYYRAPARYDDVLCVKTEITYMRRATIRFDYVISDEEGNRTYVDGYTVHAFTDGKGKIVRAPKYVAEIISKLGGECRW